MVYFSYCQCFLIYLMEKMYGSLFPSYFVHLNHEYKQYYFLHQQQYYSPMCHPLELIKAYSSNQCNCGGNESTKLVSGRVYPGLGLP